jgi:zinc transporter
LSLATASVDEGVVCAFALDPTRRLGADALLGVGVTEAPRWLHLNLVDARVRRWVSAREDIPQEAKELLLESQPRPRLEPCERGFALVLGDLHHDFDDDPEGFGSVRVYVDEQQMISARLRPIMSVGLLHPKLEHGADPHNTMELFELLLHCHDEAISRVVRRLADTVDDAEDEILAGHHEVLGNNLGKIRRLLARLRRQAHANRSSIAQLVAAKPEFWDKEQLEAIRGCRERLDGLAQDIELVSDRARLLQEEIARRLDEATNRNLFLLSTLTTALLPITLITGIFGMNLAGLPLSQNPHGFAIVMVGILVGVAGAMSFLRKRNGSG